MRNEDLARVRHMLFVSLFRTLIASLLGDALDPGSLCSFSFASTRLFGCGLFACRNSLCSKLSFLFRGLFYTSLALLGAFGHSLPVHYFPAASSLMLNLMGLYACYFSPWSPRSPLGWTARVSVNIEAPIPYCWTCSLAENIPFSYVCFRRPTRRTTEPGQGSILSFARSLRRLFFYLDACLLSLSEDLGCASFESIFLFFSLARSWFLSPWFVLIYASLCLCHCLVPLVAWFKNHFMILDAQISSRLFEALRSWSLGPLWHLYDLLQPLTTPLRHLYDLYDAFTTHGCYLAMLSLRWWRPTP